MTLLVIHSARDFDTEILGGRAGGRAGGVMIGDRQPSRSRETVTIND